MRDTTQKTKERKRKEKAAALPFTVPLLALTSCSFFCENYIISGEKVPSLVGFFQICKKYLGLKFL